MHAWIKLPLFGGTDFSKGRPILAVKVVGKDQFWQVFQSGQTNFGVTVQGFIM